MYNKHIIYKYFHYHGYQSVLREGVFVGHWLRFQRLTEGTVAKVMYC